MYAAIIAVAGTLLGALTSGWMQYRSARSARIHDLLETRRAEQLNSVTALSVAVSDHRRAMWEVVDAILTGKPEERVTELRDESHRTRSAVTEPAVRIRLLIQDQAVRDAARKAIQATYRMRDAADVDQLQEMRAAALDAHDDMVDTAADLFAAS